MNKETKNEQTGHTTVTKMNEKKIPPEWVYTCNNDQQVITLEKPDYSKMYFEFRFTDGDVAKYRMDKDCHTMQQFFDRVNHFHELEKENKRLQEQLKDYEKALNRYAKYRSEARKVLEKWGVK